MRTRDGPCLCAREHIFPGGPAGLPPRPHLKLTSGRCPGGASPQWGHRDTLVWFTRSRRSFGQAAANVSRLQCAQWRGVTQWTAGLPEVRWRTADAITPAHLTCFYGEVIWPPPWHDIMAQRAWLLLYENIYLENVLTALSNLCFTVYNMKTAFIAFAVINYDCYYCHWKPCKKTHIVERVGSSNA